MPGDYTWREARMLAVVLATTLTFLLGYLSGQFRAESQLVQCQEDEVWYPNDFTGSEKPGDLQCVHMDEFKVQP